MLIRARAWPGWNVHPKERLVLLCPGLRPTPFIYCNCKRGYLRFIIWATMQFYVATLFSCNNWGRTKQSYGQLVLSLQAQWSAVSLVVSEYHYYSVAAMQTIPRFRFAVLNSTSKSGGYIYVGTVPHYLPILSQDVPFQEFIGSLGLSFMFVHKFHFISQTEIK